MNERDRDTILARRARFVAAALAGAGIGACAATQQPQTEPPQEIIVPAADAAPSEEPLDAAPPPRAEPSAAPQPPEIEIGPRICLSEL